MAANESMPGSSRMIMGGQLGSFHSQIFYPAGPLLSPDRTLAPGSMTALHSGIGVDKARNITADFQSGGLHWFSPQDEVRMKYMRDLLDNNEQRGYFQICGTQSHPPNSVHVSPADAIEVEGGRMMASQPWSRTVDNPNNGLRGEQYNVPQMMHDRMMHKAMMPNPTVVSEGPSEVMARVTPWEARDPTPGFDRPQTDASVRATVFGVQREVPWPKAGMNTLTVGGVPYTPGLHTSPGTAAMAATAALSGNLRGEPEYRERRGVYDPTTRTWRRRGPRWLRHGPLPAARSIYDRVTREFHAGPESGVNPDTLEIVPGYVHPQAVNANRVMAMQNPDNIVDPRNPLSGAGKLKGGLLSRMYPTGEFVHMPDHTPVRAQHGRVFAWHGTPFRLELVRPHAPVGDHTRWSMTALDENAEGSTGAPHLPVVPAPPSSGGTGGTGDADAVNYTGQGMPHEIGSGWRDTLQRAASSVAHQFTDKDSTLRSKILPNAGKALDVASKVAQAAAPNSGAASALNTAKGYAETAQKVNEGAKQVGLGKPDDERGAGWRDTLQRAASSVAHQFTDKDSTLRSKILPNAGKALDVASKVAQAAAPNSGAASALNTAKGYAETAQKVNEGAKQVGLGKPYEEREKLIGDAPRVIGGAEPSAQEAEERVASSKGAQDAAQSEGMVKAHRERHTNLRYGEMNEPPKQPLSDADSLQSSTADQGGSSAAPADFMADQARQRIETMARVRDAEVAAQAPLDQSSEAVRHLHETFGDLRDPSNPPSAEYAERFMRPSRMFRTAEGYQMPPMARARESEDRTRMVGGDKEMKGGAWWDALDPAKNGVGAAFNSAGAAIKNEFENPDSKLRGEIIPAVAHEFTDKESDLRSKILPGASKALNVAAGVIPELAPLAGAVGAAQKVNQGAAAIGFGKGDAHHAYPPSLVKLLVEKAARKEMRKRKREEEKGAFPSGLA
jgi:hypothetical protein